MSHTDQQLQLALAKMLPEKIGVDNECGLEENETWLFWRASNSADCEDYIRNTEWLHVCWLVEQTLERPARDGFDWELKKVINNGKEYDTWSWTVDAPKMISASWQQRATALAKVKGVEI